MSCGRRRRGEKRQEGPKGRQGLQGRGAVSLVPLMSLVSLKSLCPYRASIFSRYGLTFLATISCPLAVG
jgi:hypothetical protein